MTCKGERLNCIQLFSNHDNNASICIALFKRLISSFGYNSSDGELQVIDKLFSFCETIFSSKTTGKVFLYLCLHGAATPLTLHHKLKIPEASVYRALKRLKALGLAEPALKFSCPGARGGPRPTVWMLKNADPSDVAKAAEVHKRLLSPKYRFAEEVAQTLLDKFTAGGRLREISYKELLLHVRELRIPFNALDVADMVAWYLQKKGVKVWR